MAALQLAPVIVPLIPAGIHNPGQPSNPPSSRDVLQAHAYLNALWEERRRGPGKVSDDDFANGVRYKAEIDSSHSLSLIAPAAPGPAQGPAPALSAIVGMPQIIGLLASLQESVNTLNTNMRQLTDCVHDLDTKVTTFHAESRRDCIALRNYHKGSGQTVPYEVVLFVDGTNPTEAQPGREGREALPAITNSEVLLHLTSEELRKYLRGYGVSPNQIPTTVAPRRRRLAQLVGCNVLV